MPRTWKEDNVFRDKVRDGKINWTHLLSRPNNRKSKSKRDHYYIATGKYCTTTGYRLIWILSKQKAEQDAETRERIIEKTFDLLRDLETKLNTYNLKSYDNNLLQNHSFPTICACCRDLAMLKLNWGLL